MRILFLGDIVGRTGREAVYKHLPKLKEDLKLDVAIVNGENASHGFGLSPKIAEELFKKGVDVITLGNHAWDRREMLSYINAEPRIIRPLNYPQATTPGRGSTLKELPDGRKILVVNVIGRLFMNPLDDPFRAINELLKQYRLGQTVHAIFVDFHAEATSEKWAFGNMLDGYVSGVVGTHTHTPTADYRILPQGTAYQTDAGMCGDYDSVIGMTKSAAINRFVRQLPTERLHPTRGESTLCGLMIETNDQTGLAKNIAPLRIGGQLSQTLPTI